MTGLRLQASYVHRLRRLSQAGAAVVLLLGVMVLTGWVVDSPVLKGDFASGITVKPNAAIAMILSGLAALCAHGAPRRPRVRLAGIACGLSACVIGALTLSQHVIGWHLGIDELLFSEAADAPATASPGRMGPPASTVFSLGGIALALLSAGGARRAAAARALGVAVVTIALLPIFGYAYKVEALYAVARYTGIALPTAIAFLALGVSILLVRPDEGFPRLLSADDAGGRALRRLLLPALLLPFVLGWVRVAGQRQGLYDLGFGTAALALVFAGTFTALLWWNALLLSRDAARQAARSAEREALLEAERAARAEAERASGLKDEFLATLSHELRTPLTAILGWTQLLKSRAVSDPAGVDHGIRTIARNAEAQARLVEDLLDMSRIVSGKLHLDARPLNLRAVVESAVQTVRPAAEAKSLRLSTDLAAGVGGVCGDAARLQQAVWNLLSNAVKFTPAGGGIAVSLRRAEGHARIEVSDDGIGMPPEFLPHAFERFRQADATPTRRHGGLGLGLAIVKQIAELHGGRVSAASDGVGEGSTFTLELPLSAPRATDESDKARPADGAGAAEPGAPLRGLRILVVDDEPDAREVVSRLLAGYDAKVSTADSAAEALRELTRERPDVLLCDIGMPGTDGYAFLRDLRARGDKLGGDVPAIAVTAYARPEDLDRALREGFCAHVAKPIDPAELVAVIARVCGCQAPAPAPRELTA